MMMERKELTILLLAVCCVPLVAAANSHNSRRTSGVSQPGDFDTFSGDGGADDGELGSVDDNYDDDGDDPGSGGGVLRPMTPIVPFITRPPDDSISIDRTTRRIDGDVEISGADGDDEIDSKYDKNLFLHPAILAAIIIGGVLIIVLVILLIMFVVYRMRKKDEGSYILDDPTLMIINGDQHKHHSSSSGYTKAPPNDNEFYA